MPVKERLTIFIKQKGISIRSFCRIVGVSQTYVTSMRNSIQPDKLTKIAIHFPELNTAWLLTGEGDMIRPPNGDMPPISRDKLIEVGTDIFKDKLIEMFTKGEIFSASIVWEQQRITVVMRQKIEELMKENERLKILLAKNGIDPQ